jgi:hypothetical protein
MSARQISFLVQDQTRAGDTQLEGLLLNAWFCALTRESFRETRVTPAARRTEHDTIQEAA